MAVMRRMWVVLVPAFLANGVSAAPAPSDDLVTIPRSEYESLLVEHEQLLAEMAEMKAFKAKVEGAQQEAAQRQDETDQALDDLDHKVQSVEQQGEDSADGSTRFLLAGYGTADYVRENRNGDSRFGAAFNPILLWKMSDKLLFEGELEMELEGSETSLALELAQLSYVVDDYVTLGFGKFLNPMNYFVERQHMGWVNKFPDKPLAVYDGLLPETQVGVQVRGGIPMGGSAKIGYALYVANASSLNADPQSVDPGELGTLSFDNFDNIGKNYAVGGRVGVLPVPELELGYGFQFSNVEPSGRHVGSTMHSVDLSYVKDVAQLLGVVNFKTQWVWSHIDRQAYDPNAIVGGPFSFRNDRNGGYVQLGYRPSHLDNRFLANLEAIFRYDSLQQARTLTGVDESRYSFGLDYWVGPSSVFKAAYELDRESGPNADHHDAVLFQFATGF